MSVPRNGRIVIVGGGCSGLLLAAQLLRRADGPLEITLLERDASRMGRGVAYGTEHPAHLLNVPAGRMSAFPEEPGHFLAWAEERSAEILDPPWVPAVDEAAFLPRRAYGAYLGHVLAEAESSAAPGVRLVRRCAEVLDIEPEGDGVRIHLQDGAVLVGDAAALALGNFPPGDPALEGPGFLRSGRYFGNPWDPGVRERLRGARSCLLLGSGLTMADWAVSLSTEGYEGTLLVLSRRGLWPQVHRATGPPPPLPDGPRRPSTVRGWMRWLRSTAARTGDWRAAVDALRPVTAEIWRALPAVEQRRFLRHVRPYWDCHRHRLPPPVAERLEALKASGRLEVVAGRLVDCQEAGELVQVRFRPRGAASLESREVAAVVNCMGSESDYRRLDSPLVKALLARGLARTDPHRLGLDTVPPGRLVDAEGRPSTRLFTLGPPRKGGLWETTAVPEIRVQARDLAQVLTAPGGR